LCRTDSEPGADLGGRGGSDHGRVRPVARGRRRAVSGAVARQGSLHPGSHRAGDRAGGVAPRRGRARLADGRAIMVSRAELSMMFRPLPLFESSVDNPAGILDLHDRPPPKLLVWQPDLVDWIFRRDTEFRHPGGRSLTPLFGDRSLLWAEGSRHAAYRAVLGPQLRGRRLAERHELVAAAVRSGLDALRPGTEVDLLAWTRGI